MKLLILSNINTANENSLGILNKVFGQAKGFISHGVNVHLIYNKLHFTILDKICDNDKIKIRPSSTKDYYNRMLKLIETNKYDCIYIRYPLSDYYFLNFLESIKKINPKINIILDFPTYPYKAEISDKNILIKDEFFNRYLREYVDLGVCYNKLNYIYDIPVYCSGNGINLKSINVKNRSIKKTNRIDLIAVANVDFWQGYDRVIQGLKIYYDSNYLDYLVYFNIVGLGNDITKLTTLVNKHGLEEYVIFQGYKSGKDLDELFDKCDIGMGTFGMYRKSMRDGATLKAREYCARGIPFVLGYEDLDFSSDFKYALKVSNDDTPININTIIEFYNKVYEDKDLVGNMRKYAEENLTWEAKLKPIINKLVK
ncbi:glycosyltransferase [Clostridium sp. ZS2-4]|uniref:glycosyltransferase n=1 Tax=Clostridium sp. ZS2-4 TaxID=2987703 RepID=UPI00227BCB64|nr:glycosyltransferase [Clostridium sp. ZS2-4]MCY6353985.1 glycosyltransferase [Clostridium sp. ZS2-4]